MSTKKAPSRPDAGKTPPAKPATREEETSADLDSDESAVGEEDPGSALDVGETETVTRDDARSSET